MNDAKTIYIVAACLVLLVLAILTYNVFYINQKLDSQEAKKVVLIKMFQSEEFSIMEIEEKE